MKNYYLLALLCCCFLPIAIEKIWHTLHESNPNKQNLLPTNHEPVLLDKIMLTEYYYSIFEPFDPNYLQSKIKEVNPNNPETRDKDEMDDWFKASTSLLMHDGECLAVINHFGFLEDTFWKNIKNLDLHPESDKKFQQLLVSIHESRLNIWSQNFSNLLYNFGKQYKLLPEIENILNTDSRFENAKQSYCYAREHAEKNELKT